LALARRSWNK